MPASRASRSAGAAFRRSLQPHASFVSLGPGPNFLYNSHFCLKFPTSSLELITRIGHSMAQEHFGETSGGTARVRPPRPQGRPQGCPQGRLPGPAARGGPAPAHDGFSRLLQSPGYPKGRARCPHTRRCTGRLHGGGAQGAARPAGVFSCPVFADTFAEQRALELRPGPSGQCEWPRDGGPLPLLQLPTCKGSSPERTRSRDSATLRARLFTVSPTCYWLTGLPGAGHTDDTQTFPQERAAPRRRQPLRPRPRPDSSKPTRQAGARPAQTAAPGDPKPRRHAQQDGVRLSRARRKRRPSERWRIFTTSRSLVFFPVVAACARPHHRCHRSRRRGARKRQGWK